MVMSLSDKYMCIACLERSQYNEAKCKAQVSPSAASVAAQACTEARTEAFLTRHVPRSKLFTSAVIPFTRNMANTAAPSAVPSTRFYSSHCPALIMAVIDCVCRLKLQQMGKKTS